MMTQVRNRPLSPRQAARARRPIDGLLHPGLFRALGDPTRLGILACLAKCARPVAVSEVAACCAVDLSVVSRHLAVLARAGLLLPQRRGRRVLYAVRYADFAGALRRLADALDQCCPSGACCRPSKRFRRESSPTTHTRSPAP